MSIREDLMNNIKEAMKAGEKERLSTLRLYLSAAKNIEIDEKGKEPLNDDEMQNLARKMVKQRRDSIEQFTAGDRKDLADKEAAEVAVLQEFMPPELGEDEIKKAISDAASEINAEGMKDMGALMKASMAKLGSAVDGKVVSELVKKQLQG